ncbi:YtxH domain-containing protein [Alkalihalobacillus sp. MEB130]|uniref:YtxH domain-containing protein n=1 Tax=Alkalihalobacillus sp. MEB130 TaxID=2976704 RepID=UPI0028DEDB64|nr:YtxH domain-containing protein [Alkalihalobacillus sp. MEB130]MDT8859212.1 YtxH domain-containing protein [Alkalihalobacillus sp. MEB130]
MFRKSKPSASRYMATSIVGGAIGAASVLFMNSERGQMLRKDLSNKVNQNEGMVSNTLLELGKEWANFGDVVDSRSETSQDQEGKYTSDEESKQ